jgi:hypothetical protein
MYVIILPKKDCVAAKLSRFSVAKYWSKVRCKVWQCGHPGGTPTSTLFSSIILTPISFFNKNWFPRFKSEITSFWIWTQIFDDLKLRHLLWKRIELRAFRARICNLLRRPGIDSQPGGSVRQPYLTYRPARLHRLASGSLNVYKFVPSFKASSMKEYFELWRPVKVNLRTNNLGLYLYGTLQKA